MDDNIELILPDNLEEPDVGGIFPDFSQVKIQVHGLDVAENMIDDITEHREGYEVFGTEEYLDPEIDSNVVELSDDYPEIQEDPEQITGDFKENILLEENHLQRYTNSHDDMDFIATDGCNENFDDIERIPDKDISQYDAVIEEYDYHNVRVKEEVEPFMGTDYTKFETQPIEENNDDSPQEDVYRCNNIIILGSKPCPSTSNSILKRLLTKTESDEEEEIKKENLDAVVLLEDWGAYLENSQTFCADCGTLFVTPNDLDAHKMTVHSFLVPISKNVAVKSTTKPALARKSTGTVVRNNKSVARKSTGSKASGSTYCNHCDQVFPDNTTLIKHLYELLTLKQFTCNICHAVFKTQKDLTNHNDLHVKTEKVRVKNETVERDVTLKIKNEVKKPVLNDSDIIPKSVLFQCPKCYIHFVSVRTGYCHFVNCKGLVKARLPLTCDVCNRNIHGRDLDMHKKQHEICTKFRIYKLIRDMYGRTLCKCSNCKLHFCESKIHFHTKDCGKIVSAMCGKCKLLLPKSKIKSHMMMHTKQNLKPKDFTIIEYSVPHCTLKRKLEPPSLDAKKIKLVFPIKSSATKILPKLKIKQEPTNIKEESTLEAKSDMQVRNGIKYRIYFCKYCNGCCYMHRSIHLNRQCTVNNQAVICQECGLQFISLKHHTSQHRKDLTLKNVEFRDVHTMKRIIPTLPNYPQCPDCKIKFFSVKIQAEHICGEDYESCDVCGGKFHSSVYDTHMDFHKLIDKKKPMKTDTKLIPELMKKYKSLNKIWHIVYSCKKCDTITDQYDKAIEHSQDHLNSTTVMKNIKCYICNLKIDETYWSKHSELHSQMSINGNGFKILSYNPRKLLTEEWFELFDSLPKEQIRQVRDKSVYDYERRFRMKLLKEGRSEFTVYCCSDCKVACRHNEIEKHINSACKNSTNICTSCNIHFSDISTLRNHQILHLKGIEKEEFRVVAFAKVRTKIKVKQPKLQTKGKAKQVKAKLQTQAKSKVIKQKLNTLKENNINVTRNKYGKLTFKGIEVDSNGKYILYKCKKCEICLHLACNTNDHCCNVKLNLRCKHCNMFINSKRMDTHVQRHEKNPDFNVNNIKISLFNPSRNKQTESEDEFEPVRKKRKTTFSCKKMKKKSKESPLKTNNKIAKAEKVIAKPKPKAETPIVTTTSKTATIYKCECGLHYTSLKNIEKHAETCNSEMEISKENCSKCGLLFPTDVLVTHLCKHHSKNSKFTVELYQKDEDVNVESTSESPSSMKTSNLQRTKLYKCGECNVHFMNKNTCYKHAYKKHLRLNQKKCIDCKLCGLQFTILGLPVHVNRHHSSDLTLDNILIEEYCPISPQGTGRMKINHYVAADKVQSLQVTSSVEE